MNTTCMEFGHYFETSIVTVGNKHVYEFAGKIRVCKNCHKTQIHTNGVWIDAPKQERQEKQPQKIDPNQLSLF